MDRKAQKGSILKFGALTQFQAKNADPGKYCDGQGLWLWKSSKTRGRWVMRMTIQGKRREMGLGIWPEVSIAEARGHAAKARRLVREGIDPIEARRESKKPQERFSLEQAIYGCFEARQAELKNDGKAGNWMSPLLVHIIPQIGKIPVEDIDQHILKKRLEPIWHEKPSAAQKALSRTNLSLRYAAALGLDVDLQAVLKTKALLGKQRHKPKHIPALAYNEAPAFYRFLCTRDSVSALAIRFLMLTCVRPGEVRFCEYKDIHDDVWILPEEKTKQGREHRVPLVGAAVEIVKLARQIRTSSYLFPVPSGRPMSDAAMAKFMRENGYSARPHGLRSSFRSWAEENSDADWETKEMSLGHTVGSSVERAYQRSDLIDKRRKLLQSWADFLFSN